MTDFIVPNSTGNVTVNVSVGRPLFIVGRNGTGKSAFVHKIYQQGGENAVYLPGNRTAIFDGEGVNLTTAARKTLTANLVSWDRSPDTRWRNISGNQRNEKAIHDLTATENQYKNDLANAISNGSDVDANVSKLQAKASPLDRVNVLLEQANIPLQMALIDGELMACAEGNTFTFARMSDGERTALILIAEIIAAKDGAVLVVDEPELHLHRSIVVPLISALIKTRPACEFVVSTHELDLPTSVPSAQVCILRSLKWDSAGAIQNWDFDVVTNADELPEELKTDILGSRRRVLFTEGTDDSLDVPMYALLFPGASVRSKGGCRAVQQAVAGVRSTTALHHAVGFGLIDNDGMSGEQIADNELEGVFALPVFSVESLYYDADVVAAVAERQAATMASPGEEQATLVTQYLHDAREGAIGAAKAGSVAEHLAARIAERQVRDNFIAQLPKRDELIAATTSEISLSGQSPYATELTRLQALIAANDMYGIISRYPVRHSGILKSVAKALKFQSRTDYEAAALTRVAADESLRHTLLSKLEPLSTELNG